MQEGVLEKGTSQFWFQKLGEFLLLMLGLGVTG
jgi:hypothetical protein